MHFDIDRPEWMRRRRHGEPTEFRFDASYINNSGYGEFRNPIAFGTTDVDGKLAG
jgi:hypothetical protein